MLHYSKEELSSIHKERMEKLLSFAGTYIHLAKMLGVTPSTAQGWVIRGRISKAGALLVENNSSLNKKFTAKYLRPDL